MHWRHAHHRQGITAQLVAGALTVTRTIRERGIRDPFSTPYPTLPYPTLPYATLPYPTLRYATLPYPTLPYPSFGPRSLWSQFRLSGARVPRGMVGLGGLRKPSKLSILIFPGCGSQGDGSAERRPILAQFRERSPLWEALPSDGRGQSLVPMGNAKWMPDEPKYPTELSSTSGLRIASPLGVVRLAQGRGTKRGHVGRPHPVPISVLAMRASWRASCGHSGRDRELQGI